MVFKRRDQLPFLQRLRESVLPRTGWLRAVKYIGLRIKRLPDTPHRIALGLSIGVMVSFTPFFGLHMLLGIIVARLFRANGLAGFLGTFFGNPLTFPFIVGMSFGLGRWIIGAKGEALTTAKVHESFYQAFYGLKATVKSWFGYGHSEIERMAGFWHEIFWPYLLGGILAGPLFGLLTYFLARPMIQAYQNHRRKKLMAKIRKQAASDRAEG